MKFGITRTVIWLRKQTPAARRELAEMARVEKRKADNEEWSVQFNAEWALGVEFAEALLDHGVTRRVLKKAVGDVNIARSIVLRGFANEV